MVRQLKSKQEFEELKAGSKLVVVDFYATWCGPCKVIAPKIDALAAEEPTVEFVKVDVDELEDVAGEAGITCMPTFQFYKGGAKLDVVEGANEGKIKELVAKHK
eukprot:NODE_10809_length_575_cov_74.685841_g10532_i0.p2 GENE.NODE_10809_length_575_cov_74.685841_g10532_i0~~NODE_10809_length_575_cov_74.685841_g10532_i0.p2  ORF type:complete len:104 (-),score=46.84 NODE_10809_length_575_cov_74.685841_g10532_i0:198-509(-)